MIPASPSGASAVVAAVRVLADQVKQLWCALADETVTGLPAQTVAELPGILTTMTGNVDTRRPGHRPRPPARSGSGPR